MPKTKLRVIRQLLAIVRADYGSFVASYTFPHGDITSLDLDLVEIHHEYLNAINDAEEILQRHKV